MLENYILEKLKNENNINNINDFIGYYFSNKNNEYLFKNSENCIFYFFSSETIENIFITYKYKNNISFFEYKIKNDNLIKLFEIDEDNLKNNIFNDTSNKLQYYYIFKNIVLKNSLYKTNEANLAIEKFDFAFGSLNSIYIKKDNKHIEKLKNKKITFSRIFNNKLKRIFGTTNINNIETKNIIKKFLEKLTIDKTSKEYTEIKTFLENKKEDIYNKNMDYYNANKDYISEIITNEENKTTMFIEIRKKIINKFKENSKEKKEIEFNNIIYPNSYLNNLKNEVKNIEKQIELTTKRKAEIFDIFFDFDKNISILGYMNELKKDIKYYTYVVYLYNKFLNIKTNNNLNFPDFFRFPFIQTYNYLSKKPLLTPFFIKDQNIYFDINIYKYLYLNILAELNKLFDNKVENNIYEHKNLYYKIVFKNEIQDFEIIDNFTMQNDTEYNVLEYEKGEFEIKSLTLYQIVNQILDLLFNLRYTNTKVKEKLTSFIKNKKKNYFHKTNEIQEFDKLYSYLIKELNIRKIILDFDKEKSNNNKKLKKLEENLFNLLLLITNLKERNTKMEETLFNKRTKVIQNVIEEFIRNQTKTELKIINSKEFEEKDINKLVKNNKEYVEIDKQTLLLLTGIIIRYLLNTKNTNDLKYSEIETILRQISVSKQLNNVIEKLLKTTGKNESLKSYFNEYLFLINKIKEIFEQNMNIGKEDMTYIYLGITYPRKKFSELIYNKGVKNDD